MADPPEPGFDPSDPRYQGEDRILSMTLAEIVLEESTFFIGLRHMIKWDEDECVAKMADGNVEDTIFLAGRIDAVKEILQLTIDLASS